MDFNFRKENQVYMERSVKKDKILKAIPDFM